MCINDRLVEYIEVDILANEQVGFRESYSTIDHMLVLHIALEMYLAVKKQVYCALIDYKKAFDSLQRQT